MIRDELKKIKGTLPPGVTLVAVSKTKSPAEIREAYDAGQRDFGENYVQELVTKAQQLPEDIRWHFIGHLQSNKVKQIAPFVHLIHGVDSLKLLKEIDKQARNSNRVIDCLIQIHIAREETKFGLSTEECRELMESDAARSLKHVRIRGLMGMASNSSDLTVVRNEFRLLSELFRWLKAQHPQLDTLSTGMSGDYKIAVEEGSTMVRVGSLIFGSR